MRVPLSWLKEYVDIDIAPELLAERLTTAGLEVASIEYIGVPQNKPDGVMMPPSDHLVWDRERIVLGAVWEVKQHPNADKLVIATVDFGASEAEQVVTGAPNLAAYKDQGRFASPLWTGLALEGAEVWDGHSDELKRMILKGKELRGIYNKSMVCSEKELGMSEEHEGIILFHDQPTDQHGKPHQPGTPLQDVFGDVVFEVELTPNLARCFSMIGVAREVAALLDKELRYPSFEVGGQFGVPIGGAVEIVIRDIELNPRFVGMLLRHTQVQPSPEWMQRRLRLVGQRPINNLVDVTNYITFELGQPLHAFDYDKLVARANGNTPTIITRLPHDGETLTTLDGVQRELPSFSMLVTDTAGVLSIGGVMGGADSEIDAQTTNVLLEGAAWNFINIRKTTHALKLFTEAGTRFSRGVHPSQALLGVKRGIELMRLTGGGQVADGVLDVYPRPQEQIEIVLKIADVNRVLGMEFDIDTAADILRRLEFAVERTKNSLRVGVPDHRMDISAGVIGQADLLEEIARINGYDNIPNSIIADEMPAQLGNRQFELEEWLRDILVALGLQENISYRFTTPEREALLVPPGEVSCLPNHPYVEMANPISADKTVLRHTLLANLLDNAHQNARYFDRQAVFEIGNVYFKREGQPLPDEPRRLGLLMLGKRSPITHWATPSDGVMDFFDMKGLVEGMLDALHITDYTVQRSQHTTFHPGRSAELILAGQSIGVFGELHPRVSRVFGFGKVAVMAAEFDLDALLQHVNVMKLEPLPITPPILQDIAVVVDANISAGEVQQVIMEAGSELLKEVRLFDVYMGEPIPSGKKSIAYSLTYQTDERTLTDKEVANLHKRIVKALQTQVNGELRA